MDSEELPPSTKYLFVTIMRAAFNLKKIGLSRSEFEYFTSEVWATLELIDKDESKETL